MATDNSPPRLKLIVTIGVITLVTLIGLNFVLTSYFAYMTDMAQREHMAPTTDLIEHRKAEQAALTGAKISVNQAMDDLAKGKREALVAPQQSDDLGPMTGWSKLPRQAPEAHPSTPEEAAADAGAEVGDGGATTTATGDAGAAAADAGAAHGHEGHDAGAAPAPHH